ncbi:hypothetical protein NLM33_25090 [Bradyrhizobium sp. CCGUVB1N3]|uniref:hypothetical protein n=1 Tax=Bradyrhizobium sp. CCGUVB1N3 TaxID=2949629 RepID=UPI0020B1BE8A|nr:hypothetical protein [Bradyrhizobium sp. CCGUVB1N3]MCP3471812.1 hypothetical protein [Bradyrhizobium sp. CCGUVB1N3]MCP3473594.1 hypothetical protein [Bradyrhizobium sp. CCGUVB1N3]
MGGRRKAPVRGLRTPIGNRVKVLVMLDPVVVADIKDVAIEERRAAWSVIEDAAREYVERRKQKRAKLKT